MVTVSKGAERGHTASSRTNSSRGPRCDVQTSLLPLPLPLGVEGSLTSSQVCMHPWRGHPPQPPIGQTCFTTGPLDLGAQAAAAGNGSGVSGGVCGGCCVTVCYFRKGHQADHPSVSFSASLLSDIPSEMWGDFSLSCLSKAKVSARLGVWNLCPSSPGLLGQCCHPSFPGVLASPVVLSSVGPS